MSYADALIREAAWLRADVVGLPPLLANTGDGTGPFGVVEAYPRKVQQQDYQLFVCRDPYAERRMDAAGQWRAGMHGIALLILWNRVVAPTKAQLDQVKLDEAVDRVLNRVRGFPADHTHGGRFHSVGVNQLGTDEIRVEYPDPRTLDATADAPYGAGDAYTVLVRYTATDAFGG